jgi:hypothetical protein
MMIIITCVHGFESNFIMTSINAYRAFKIATDLSDSQKYATIRTRFAFY